MRRSHINLATHPLGNQLLPRLVLLALGLTAILCTFANLNSYATNASLAHAFAKKVRATEVEISDLQMERRQVISAIREQDVTTLAMRVDAANGLLQKRGFSWTRLFNRLEEVQPYRVQLERVQPAIHGEVVTLSIGGEAETFDGLLEYIDSLEASAFFSHVYPKSDFITERKAFRFILTMVYHPDADDTRREEPSEKLASAAAETE